MHQVEVIVPHVSGQVMPWELLGNSTVSFWDLVKLGGLPMVPPNFQHGGQMLPKEGPHYDCNY